MKIALLGYGKMGKTIEHLAVNKGHEIVFKASANSSDGDITLADVAIDFSTPEAAFDHITRSFTLNIPVVSGTTGWLDRYEEILKICESRNGSFLYASNFSVGVNLFFRLNELLAEKMKAWPEYEVGIKEIHHIEKKDAPSGTAISLADGIIQHSTKKNWVLGASHEDSIGIEAERIEEVKGTHIVEYSSQIDTLSIKHEAHTREGFALGAILAAQWIQGKKGVYSMRDVLA